MINHSPSNEKFWFYRKSKLYIYKYTKDEITLEKELKIDMDVYDLINGPKSFWINHSDRW